MTFWKPLIKQIKVNGIVPVIGSDLSVLELTSEDCKYNIEINDIVLSKSPNGKYVRVNLYDYLALLLAEEYGIEGGHRKMNLNHVVLELLKNETENTVYDTIEEIFKKIKDRQVLLDPFKKLVKISGFKAYISVSFDNFIERAFREEPIPINLPWNFSIPFPEYYPNRKDNRALPSLYNLMGSIEEEKNFALTDEQFLEYIYLLRERNKPCVSNLFESIENKSLLLIGCSFPDWLMRFFIRILANERYIIEKKGKIIADNGTSQDHMLSTFLKNYKVKIITIDETQFCNAVDFVDQLYDQWMKENHFSRAEIKYRERIFLSFSSKDRVMVEQIKNEFENQGVDVFYDESDLEAGDLYNSIIPDEISKNCRYFVPLISNNSLSDKSSYVYRIEWNLAIAKRLLNEKNKKTSFIKPYIIDGMSLRDNRIPPEFTDLTIGSINPDPVDITAMVKAFIQNNQFTLRTL